MADPIRGPILLSGAGKMGGAMLEGWLEAGLEPREAAVLEPFPSARLARLAEAGLILNPSAPDPDRPPAVIVIAVKPQMMAEALPGLAPWRGAKSLILSIAAGQTLANFAAAFGDDAAIVRAMPNTPAAIGRGVTAACANAHVDGAGRDLATRLLAAVGRVEWLDDEALMDAVTAVSGSGPAYVFHLVEAMAAAGTRLGLPEDVAMRLARGTVTGAGALLDASEDETAKLRENVTSPAGTTAAALSVLMAEPGLTELMTRAMTAARDRGRELAG